MSPPASWTIALPLAAATLAYLNGRFRVTNDLPIIRAAGNYERVTQALERSGRLNTFYQLEELALDVDSNGRRKKVSPPSSGKEFLVFEGRTYTYKDFYNKVLQYASWLKYSFDVRPKEVVALDFTNSDHFILLWFALWSLGAIPAFLNHNLTGQPLVHCVKVSSTRLVLVEEALASAFNDSARTELSSAVTGDGRGTQIISFDASAVSAIEQHLPHRAPDADRHIERMKETSILIYTSGTTGFPKPAIVNWWKAYSGFSFAGPWMGTKSTDRFYTSMPLYHSSAALLGLLLCMGAECTFVVGRRFSASRFWGDVRESRSTIIQYVGETLRYLLSNPPSTLDTKHNVRIAFGNGLRPDIWTKFQDRFAIPTIAELYTATESTNGSWSLSRNAFSAGAIDTSGSLVTYITRQRAALIEIDIETEEPLRDPITKLCKRVKSRQVGELLYNISDDPSRKPEDRFVGYFGNKKASDSKILRNAFVEGDAWYRTGDLMVRDEENRVFFYDRMGDTFRWKGENTSTAEVAEVLGRHAAVAEANVYGVKLPHHDGRAGCAAVIPHRGMRCEQRVMEDLAEHLASNLPRYAIPLFIRVMDEGEMEMTGTNKQTKQSLRNQGVDLNQLEQSAAERTWWLKNGRYVPFRMPDWRMLSDGAVKL